jgi:hypothetical protein
MAQEFRIGDAEREQAVSALGEHYLAGRLTKDEYDERAAAAWEAKTASALDPLFRDLPNTQPQTVVRAAPKPGSPRGRSRRRGLPVLPLLVLFILVMALTPLHLAWWGWLILGWMWVSGMFARLGLRACGGKSRRS